MRKEDGSFLRFTGEHMPFTDQTLSCRDCQQAFTFTAGEQEFYESRGMTNAPSRCPECRAAHKQSNRVQRAFSGGVGGRVPHYESPQMDSATCACRRESNPLPL